MTLFAPSAGPRVFGMPPGADFARAIVAGLDARLGGAPPEALARVEIWVNTQRSRRALAAAFAEGPPRLLPRIRVVTELGSDPRETPDLPPPFSALGRRLELTRLVAALLAAEPGLAPGQAAFDLAAGLDDLIDEMAGEGVAPAALGALDAGAHAEHWRAGLRFLELAAGFAAARPSAGGQARMRAAAEALAAVWATAPPAHPVIVAGSTGSRGATRRFMEAVARLPQGALVLPGFDFDLPAEVWARLGARDAGAADHPQAGFRRLADAVGFDLAAVAPWRPGPPPAPARNRLAALALRPAPVTHAWRAEGAALVPTLGDALARVTWIEAETPRAEARALALALREALEAGRRAALVTPDRALARRVTAELSRWGVRPDDSAGRPLGLTPPGVLLRRLAALGAGPLTPEALLALLRHPLTASAPAARRRHLALLDRLELEALRGGPPEIGWDDLVGWGAAKGGDAPGWIAWLAATLGPSTIPGPATLAERVARHRAAAEALAAGPGGGPHALWDKDAGAAAQALLDELAAEAEVFGPIAAADYRALIPALMRGRDVPEEAAVTHPGVAIWGTLEARVQTAEVVLLGGLVEGVWPRLPSLDPWLSRGLRRDLGLPSPERVVGLSAHDFQQAFAGAEVVLSRATRDADAPTVPSRWLLRLENLLAGLGPEGAAALAAARARGAALRARATALDAPMARAAEARRPAPRPPAHALPARLSVTQIETLVRDPYAIYARHVLRLRPLDPLGREADALERGSALHAALEAFLAATPGDLPPDVAGVFARETAAALARAAPWPAVRAFWAARLARSADWFLEGEAERRSVARPFARERRGRLDVAGLAAPFAVTARADRIDRAEDGSYAIYDYKSGGVPSAQEAAAFHLQLPLEGAIAAAGGFEDAPPGPAFRLQLLGIGARKTRAIATGPAETLARLPGLLDPYLGRSLGFAARLRPQRIGDAGDYDHLARFGEWSDGDPIVAEDVG